MWAIKRKFRMKFIAFMYRLGWIEAVAFTELLRDKCDLQDRFDRLKAKENADD